MKSTELKVLAHKIQLVIREEEMKSYLEIFSKLEKQLVNFKKLKIGKKVKPMTRIDTGFLTLADLKKLKERYTSQRVDKRTLKNNAETTNDQFILFNRKYK